MNDSTNRVDLTFLRNFSNQNEEKLKHYIGVYLKTATQLFGELEKRMDSMPFDEIYTRVHSLKPQVRYSGIRGLTELLAEVEEAVRNNAGRAVVKRKLEEAIEINRLGMLELEMYLPKK